MIASAVGPLRGRYFPFPVIVSLPEVGNVGKTFGANVSVVGGAVVSVVAVVVVVVVVFVVVSWKRKMATTFEAGPRFSF